MTSGRSVGIYQHRPMLRTQLVGFADRFCCDSVGSTWELEQPGLKDPNRTRLYKVSKRSVRVNPRLNLSQSRRPDRRLRGFRDGGEGMEAALSNRR